MKRAGMLCMLIMSVAGAKPVTFDLNIARYYGDAAWVCRDFEHMHVSAFIASWCQLVALIGDAERRWFYWADDAIRYQQLEEQRYSTVGRYVRESLAVQWVSECKAYDAFLMTHTVDQTSGMLVRCEPKERDYQQEGQQQTLLDVVCQLAPEQVFAFYAFFFEQLSNVLLSMSSYTYDNSDSAEGMQALGEYSQLFSTTYTVCTHRVKAGTPAQLKVLNKQYERVPSVMMSAATTTMKKIDGDNPCVTG